MAGKSDMQYRTNQPAIVPPAEHRQVAGLRMEQHSAAL